MAAIIIIVENFRIDLGFSGTVIHINKFLNDPPENYKFLEPQNNIEAISWFDSILFFHNINSLYIVYREKWKSKHNNTKKIYIRKKLVTTQL